MELVELRDYKVAYREGGKVLKSKMFDSLEQAKSFICQLPSSNVYTLMKIQRIGEGSYDWVILSNGAGKFVPAMSWVYKNRKNVGIGLGVFVLYKILK